ncbi:AMP-binding protein [Aquabacterium sp.]|uniref:AMP-binding protein n=1 Tax=Aquabacterium sp. TaxID=1872578 RepID=UPI00248934CC|nr:AMP-binding protein [Aquabacterium sp.]MDI1260206.1 AMP-binding protein [Aquabacterium sp.]
MDLLPLRNEQDILTFEQAAPLEARIPHTVYEVFKRRGDESPASMALSMVMTGENDEAVHHVSYGQLLAGITAAANLFVDIGGVGLGVAYMLPALTTTHEVLWGAETAGYAVPLNPMLNVEELVSLIQASGAKVLVSTSREMSAELATKAEQIQARISALTVLCVGTGQNELSVGKGVNDYQSAISRQPFDKLAFDRLHDPDAIVAYFHTGGTTGIPKLVAHTNKNQLTAALGAAVMLGITADDVASNGMPLFHVGGTIASSLAFFMQGARVVMLSPTGMRNPAMINNFWRIVERQKVTIFGAVPTALSALLNVPVNGDLKLVRFGITGAAAIPRKVAESFMAMTGRRLHEVLGMTESGGVTAIDPAAGQPTLGSVGLRLPYTQLTVRRRGEDGQWSQECATGEIGVLFVRGPHVSPGYIGAHTPAETPFGQGELNTGDLAFKDSEGKLHIAGRAKDLIIRSGHNIDPAMIEAAFLEHPCVAAAAAVGQIDAYAGELPVCYVVLKPEAQESALALADFAKVRINERPAWPKAVYLIQTLPVTTVGKVYKPALRADAASRVLTDVLGPLAGAAFVGVSVVEGGPRGLRATVHLKSPSADVLAAVDGAVGHYLIDCQVQQD